MAVLKSSRVEPSGTPKQLVVFCHGYGSNGDDLISLSQAWNSTLPDVVWVSPNAPEEIPGMPGYFQWFEINDLDRNSPEAMEMLSQGARQAVRVLDAFLDEELRRYNLPESSMALVGFSQGTMMALHSGLRRMDAPAGILGYSGLLTNTDSLKQEINDNPPPVQLIHGSDDERLPVGAMTAAKEALIGANVDVRTHISPNVGHGIAPDGLALGGRFLVEIFSGKA